MKRKPAGERKTIRRKRKKKMVYQTILLDPADRNRLRVLAGKCGMRGVSELARTILVAWLDQTYKKGLFYWPIPWRP